VAKRVNCGQVRHSNETAIEVLQQGDSPLIEGAANRRRRPAHKSGHKAIFVTAGDLVQLTSNVERMIAILVLLERNAQNETLSRSGASISIISHVSLRRFRAGSKSSTWAIEYSILVRPGFSAFFSVA